MFKRLSSGGNDSHGNSGQIAILASSQRIPGLLGLRGSQDGLLDPMKFGVIAS
jgi:hypothetical protein